MLNKLIKMYYKWLMLKRVTEAAALFTEIENQRKLMDKLSEETEKRDIYDLDFNMMYNATTSVSKYLRHFKAPVTYKRNGAGYHE